MGELFAGIGGFSLGFRRAGFDVVWQVEIEPYCRKVLEKNFPEAERYNDVREVGKHNLCPVDVICAGWPCQDLSFAGLGAGLDGERSGLVTEAIRVVSELRPKFVVLENVAAIIVRGLGRVLGMLAEIGYDAEWDCIPASFVGAPHRRDRIWIVAYPQRSERGQESYDGPLGRMGRFEQPVPWDRDWQSALRHFRGVDYGLTYGVDRVDSIRNGLVPQIPEWIARRILEAA